MKKYISKSTIKEILTKKIFLIQKLTTPSSLKSLRFREEELNNLLEEINKFPSKKEDLMLKSDFIDFLKERITNIKAFIDVAPATDTMYLLKKLKEVEELLEKSYLII